MVDRRKLIGLVGASAYAQTKAPIRDHFLGVWTLISCERKSKDGKVDYPYGEKPIGRITYDHAGRMSAQLMRPGRRSTVPPGVGLSSATVGTEELRETAAGFQSYFGTFDIDEASSTVIHHVQASFVPSWVGTDLKRTYKFSSNRLALRAAYLGGFIDLIWEREPD
jgi:hypothetical protein